MKKITVLLCFCAFFPVSMLFAQVIKIDVAKETNILVNGMAIHPITKELWIVTTKGLYKVRSLSDSTFHSEQPINRILQQPLRSLCIDAVGNTWLGTYESKVLLIKVQSDIIQIFKLFEDDKKDLITGIVSPIKNQVLISTAENGLYEANISQNTSQPLNKYQYLESCTLCKRAYRMFFDDYKNVFTAPNEGLVLYNNIDKPKNMSIGEVTALGQYKDSLWVAILDYDRKTSIYQIAQKEIDITETIKNEQIKGVFSENNLPYSCLVQDKENDCIWIAKGGEIVQYSSKKGYLTFDKITNEVINDIIIDKHKNAWISTLKSIYFVSKKHFEKIKIDTNNIKKQYKEINNIKVYENKPYYIPYQDQSIARIYGESWTDYYTIIIKLMQAETSIKIKLTAYVDATNIDKKVQKVNYNIAKKRLHKLKNDLMKQNIAKERIIVIEEPQLHKKQEIVNSLEITFIFNQ